MSVWIKFGVLSFAILGLLATGTAQAQGRGQGNGAAGNVVNLRGGQAVPGQYIVVLEDGVADPAAVANDMARAHGLGLGFVYGHALKGFSANIPDGAVAALSRDPRVAFIEADQTVTLFGHAPTGIHRIYATGNGNIDIDGFDDVRIDVDVAVIDTGIDYDHPDLNVVFRTDCTGGPYSQSCSDNSGNDGNGHGTHVAGTIGALDNGDGIVGVAPGARLWAVKVLKNNGRGWMSNVVAGVDWVTGNGQIEVANMSLGCGCDSAALDLAITNSVAAGVIYAVAAGNSAANAASYTPANHPDVITVSALADFDGLAGGGAGSTCRSDVDDTLADFSNYGATVEIIAPGVCILSTWSGGGTNTISGTSMASPHVAGAAALLASGTASPTNKAEVDAIINTLITAGNYGWTGDHFGDLQEPLLDVSDTGVFAPATVPSSEGGPAPVVNSPSVEITSPSGGVNFASGAVIDFAGSASDVEDDDLPLTGTLAWASDMDGALGFTGSGGSAMLTDGSHTITASVTDLDGNPGSASVDITVGDLGPFTVALVSYDSHGGQGGDKHLSVFVDVDPDVIGTLVSIRLTETGSGVFWDGAAASNEFGVVGFSLKNAPAGCYTTDVTDINGDTSVATPANSFALRGSC